MKFKLFIIPALVHFNSAALLRSADRTDSGLESSPSTVKNVKTMKNANLISMEEIKVPTKDIMHMSLVELHEFVGPICKFMAQILPSEMRADYPCHEVIQDLHNMYTTGEFKHAKRHNELHVFPDDFDDRFRGMWENAFTGKHAHLNVDLSNRNVGNHNSPDSETMHSTTTQPVPFEFTEGHSMRTIHKRGK